MKNKSIDYIAISVLFLFLSLIFNQDAYASESLYFLHQDNLGSTNLVTDSQGSVAEQKVYYPYGESRITSHVSPVTERGYTGQISDQEQTGLYYYNARYYNPLIAKFTQADTIGSGNRYAYVGNNPINSTDPSGHKRTVDGNRYVRGSGDFNSPTNPISELATDIGSRIAYNHWLSYKATHEPDKYAMPKLDSQLPYPYAEIIGGAAVAVGAAWLAAPAAGALVSAIPTVSIPYATQWAVAQIGSLAVSLFDVGFDIWNCLGGNQTACLAIFPDIVVTNVEISNTSRSIDLIKVDRYLKNAINSFNKRRYDETYALLTNRERASQEAGVTLKPPLVMFTPIEDVGEDKALDIMATCSWCRSGGLEISNLLSRGRISGRVSMEKSLIAIEEWTHHRFNIAGYKEKSHMETYPIWYLLKSDVDPDILRHSLWIGRYSERLPYFNDVVPYIKAK